MFRPFALAALLLVVACRTPESALSLGDRTLLRSEDPLQVATALETRLPFLSSRRYLHALRRHPEDPRAAIEGLVRLKERLEGDALIPAALHLLPPESLVGLAPPTLEAINEINGDWRLRERRFEEALPLLRAAPSRSRARYLEAIALVDPSFPGGSRPEEARNALEALAKLPHGPEPTFLMLALGRIAFGQGGYHEAMQWFERAADAAEPSEAIFGAACARLQSDDLRGALRALRDARLRLEQVPEAAIVEAEVLFFDLQFAAVEAPLGRLDPMTRDLDAVLARLEALNRDPPALVAMLRRGEVAGLPPHVLAATRHPRLQRMFRVLDQIDLEVAALSFSPELRQELEEQRRLLTDFAATAARNHLRGAALTLKTLGFQAEVLRFETAKAQGDLRTAHRLLTRIAGHFEDGSPVKAELLFQLAVFARDLGDHREARRALEGIVRDYPRYERLGDVRELLAN